MTDDTREHPLLMKGELVRATFAGQKTQTRRVVTRANSRTATRWDWLDWSRQVWVDDGPSPAGNPGPYLKVHAPCIDSIHRLYPRVQVGDRLWVRETFARVYDCPPDCHGWDGEHDGKCEHLRNVYRATEPQGLDGYANRDDDRPCRWTPSIHMPRAACRLVLPVTRVRVERVQDITEDDARAEGVPVVVLDGGSSLTATSGVCGGGAITARETFATLWDRINGPRGYGWDANPWVWVYEWETLDPAAGG